MSRSTLLPCALLALGLVACATPSRAPTAATLVDSSIPAAPIRASAPAEAPTRALGAESQDSLDPFASAKREAPRWHDGQALMHGFLGVTSYSTVEISGEVNGDDGDLDELPVIGGGAQWKVGGRRIDWGLEGLLSFAGRANATAFVVGGGGAAVAVDVDLLLFELYGGPFVSLFLGEKVRLYGAAGPLLQWASYDQNDSVIADEDGSGFGSGYYARAGFEFALPSRALVGFGARWSDTSVDLGSSIGDLDIDGVQILFTMTTGL